MTDLPRRLTTAAETASMETRDTSIFDFARSDDFSEDRPSLGLSGGINSAALLCHLATVHPEHKRPRVLLLYYADLKEHSPGTRRFVAHCVRYARRHFPRVLYGSHKASVNKFFEAENFIPHPMFSPCTEHLKVKPMHEWTIANGGTIDLIGFVQHERRRIKAATKSVFDAAKFLIAHYTEDECFAIVDREIGWHPSIYDIRDKKNRRVFTHNNCLPCKNMTLNQIRSVAEHYPEYWATAQEMAERINNYWGRPSEYPADPCASCVFD